MHHNVNKAGQTHDQLQAACWRWACKAYHPFVYRRLIAIPNDMHAGNVVRWKQYEAIGVTPGVWDMQLLWIKAEPLIIPWTYWWEFKVGTDSLRDNQKKFRDKIISFGNTFFIAEEEDEFQAQFKSIMEPTIDYAKRIFKGESEWGNIKKD